MSEIKATVRREGRKVIVNVKLPAGSAPGQHVIPLSEPVTLEPGEEMVVEYEIPRHYDEQVFRFGHRATITSVNMF